MLNKFCIFAVIVAGALVGFIDAGKHEKTIGRIRRREWLARRCFNMAFRAGL